MTAGNTTLEMRPALSSEFQSAKYFTVGKLTDMEESLSIIESADSQHLVVSWEQATLPKTLDISETQTVRLDAHGNIKSEAGEKVGVYGTIDASEHTAQQKIILHLKRIAR